MKFTKKPVTIEAWPALQLLLDAAGNWDSLPQQIREAYDRGELVFAPDGLLIRTLEGTMTADPTDMVICGVKGELYPCKPDIFGATYEPAEE